MTQGKDTLDPTPKLPSQRGRSKPESPFDQWLTRGLHQLFDDVAKEPIPDELLRLIQDDKA